MSAGALSELVGVMKEPLHRVGNGQAGRLLKHANDPLFAELAEDTVASVGKGFSESVGVQQDSTTRRQRRGDGFVFGTGNDRERQAAGVAIDD